MMGRKSQERRGDLSIAGEEEGEEVRRKGREAEEEVRIIKQCLELLNLARGKNLLGLS